MKAALLMMRNVKFYLSCKFILTSPHPFFELWFIIEIPGVGICGTQEPMNPGSRWVPGSRQSGPKWVPGSTSEPWKWVDGKLWVNYGFQWVPGSGSEPKKWVQVGSGFRVGTQKVGSSGFRVPTNFFLCRPLKILLPTDSFVNTTRSTGPEIFVFLKIFKLIWYFSKDDQVNIFLRMIHFC